MRKFTVMQDYLLTDLIVTQVVEVAPNMFLVGCWGTPWVGLVDRLQKTLIKIECPTAEEIQCTDLVPLPGFNAQSFPFLVQRNSKALNLIDLAGLSMHRLVLSDNQSGAFEKLSVDADPKVLEQVRLTYIAEKSKIMQTSLESNFIRQLKEIAAASSTAENNNKQL